MLALYRTYRPATFESVIGQEHVITTIQNQILSGSVSHAYLFTGPRGVGKTTIARLLAKAVNCTGRTNPASAEPCNSCEACLAIVQGNALDIFEIDAASNTDVDHVRENIIRTVRFAPTQLQKKVYIIDEVHMLSTSAFNALLKTLEEPPAHVLFVLATTEIHKVPATILSRCQRYDFRKMKKEDMIKRLQFIAEQESRVIEPSVLDAIAKYSGGSERDAESLLGQILALQEGDITMDVASLVLPLTSDVLVDQFLEPLFEKKAKETVLVLNAHLEQGVDLSRFLDDVILSVRDRLLLQMTERNKDALDFCRKTIELLLKAKRHLRTDEIPQLPVELAIVELCMGAIPTVSHPTETKTEEVVISPVQNIEPTKEVNKIMQKTEIPSQIEEARVVLNPVLETETTVPVMEMAEAFVLEPVEAKPLETSEHVFDTIPVIGVNEIKQKWPEVFAQVQECNASLPLFLQACEVQDVKEGMVELAFEYDLYVQTINKDKNRKLIESILERVLGKAVKIRAVLAQKKQQDDVVAGLLDAFGGSAV